MLRISKLADYAIVLLTYFDSNELYTPRDLAELSGLPDPTVAKLLRALSRGGILGSQRGAKGGYSLARPPAEISVAEVIDTVDGPVALTGCSSGDPGRCLLKAKCPVSHNWQSLSSVVKATLENVSLTQMTSPGGVPNPKEMAR